jgi:hypothetical protein
MGDPHDSDRTREDGDESEDETQPRERFDARESSQLDDDVQRAPEIGDFVFEQPSCEREDAVEGLE